MASLPARAGHLMCKSHSGRNYENTVLTCDSHMTLSCNPSLSSPYPFFPLQWSGTVNVWTPSKLQMVCSEVPEEEEEDGAQFYPYYDSSD